MSKLFTADKATGTFIDEVKSIDEGLQRIKEYEAQDELDGTFEADFYDVVDEEHCSQL